MPFAALLLKEFHEQKWRVLSLSTIYIAVMAYCLPTDYDGPSMGYTLLINCHIFFGSTFLAMSVIASEHSASTINFTSALPTHPKNIITAKLIAAIVSISIPILIITAMLLGWLALGNLNKFHLYDLSLYSSKASFTTQILVTSFLYLIAAWTMTTWFIAISINRRSELTVASTVILAIALYAILSIGFQFLFDTRSWPTLKDWWLRASPYGLAYTFGGRGNASRPPIHIFQTIALQLAILTALVTYIRHRFTHQSNTTTATAKDPQADHPAHPTLPTRPTRRLPNPFTSTFAALFWQQTRVARPVICGAVIIFIAMTFIFLSAESLELQAKSITTPTVSIKINADGTSKRYFTPAERILIRRQNKLYDAAENRLELANTLSMFPPLLLAILVGVSLFSGDLRDNQLAFWRSRPISPTTWLFIRYTIGACAIFLAIYGPGILTHAFYTPTQDYLNYKHTHYIRTLLTMPWIQLGTYTAAVLITIIIRQPIYAGILSLGAMLFFIINPSLGLLSKPSRIAQNIFYQFEHRSLANYANTPSQDLPFYLIWFFAILIMTTAAYLLIRRNAALEHWFK